MCTSDSTSSCRGRKWDQFGKASFRRAAERSVHLSRSLISRRAATPRTRKSWARINGVQARRMQVQPRGGRPPGEMGRRPLSRDAHFHAHRTRKRAGKTGALDSDFAPTRNTRIPVILTCATCLRRLLVRCLPAQLTITVQMFASWTCELVRFV